MKVPDLYVGKRLFVGDGGMPKCLGIGPLETRGSAYIEGPLVVGDPNPFPLVYATVMIGPNINDEAIPPSPVIPGVVPTCLPVNHSPYSLAIDGDCAIFDHLDVNGDISNGGDLNSGGDIKALGEVMSRCGAHVLSAKKNFDIPHPSKEGWRLRHTCPEGPSNDVYFRGRVTNKTAIQLPLYWKDFVDIQSITVNLTPIGAHQDVIVKRIDEDMIHLQAKGGMPIDCFYHVYAERKDGEKLIPEYEGTTPADYPGNNEEYSVSGYHYDTKEN
jgi:hypothetical protein